MIREFNLILRVGIDFNGWLIRHALLIYYLPGFMMEDIGFRIPKDTLSSDRGWNKVYLVWPNATLEKSNIPVCATI